MAHTKAQGAASRIVNVAGKRLGIKRFAGQFVTAGSIIVRQHGSTFHAGKNALLAKDYTVFASADGYVSFRNMTGSHRAQKYIDILPTLQTKALKVAKVPAKKISKPSTAKTSTSSKKAEKSK